MKTIDSSEIFYYRMRLIIDAFQKRKLEFLPREFNKATMEERDSILKGLLEQNV